MQAGGENYMNSETRKLIRSGIKNLTSLSEDEAEISLKSVQMIWLFNQ